MKTLILFILVTFNINSVAQSSGTIATFANVPTILNDPPVLIGVNPFPNNQWKVYVKDSIKWEPYNINGLKLYIFNESDARYKNISYVPSSAEVISALGYTPLSVEVDPLFNTKFTGKTTSDLIEGTNLYHTDTRSRNSISLNTTGQNGIATYDSVTGIINVPNYTVTAGTGINISSNIITNIAPDQTVSLTGSNGIVTSGTYPNFIIAKTKKQETYSGTTNASGVYTVVFGVAYSLAPNIQANIINQSSTNQFLRVSSVSTTGFTINVFQRNSVNLLGIDVLLSATANTSGAIVDVLVTEK